ncbi:hypothetical protein [Haloplanus aerogenes]|uniref:Uncharacterized protein n=1 Tax=Haloplanus aerogenes TaxID=660522 RepID=A0A3M0CID9_9EURY|nr:hypothetical protein [Haloplanus aerogenes]AZH26018.1 hypothetical protein DU502_11895 [Haloplanus aerogenes]RMB08250.1 hypothetical protein ATH50_3666 [Haloplanus aerogenes]
MSGGSGENGITRRNMIKTVAGGSAAGLAGCSSKGGQEEGGEDGEGNERTTDVEDTSREPTAEGSSPSVEFPISDDPSNSEMLRGMFVLDDLVNPDIELPGWDSNDSYTGSVLDRKGYEQNGMTVDPSVNGRVLDAMGLWDKVTKYFEARSQPGLFHLENGVPDVESISSGPDLSLNTEIEGLPVYTGTFQAKRGPRKVAVAPGENYILVQRGVGESSTDDILGSMGWQIEHLLDGENPMLDDNPECESAVEDSDGYHSARLHLFPDEERTRADYATVEEGERSFDQFNYVVETARWSRNRSRNN